MNDNEDFAKTDIPFLLQGTVRGPLLESDCTCFIKEHPIVSKAESQVRWGAIVLVLSKFCFNENVEMMDKKIITILPKKFAFRHGPIAYLMIWNTTFTTSGDLPCYYFIMHVRKGRNGSYANADSGQLSEGSFLMMQLACFMYLSQPGVHITVQNYFTWYGHFYFRIHL